MVSFLLLAIILFEHPIQPACPGDGAAPARCLPFVHAVRLSLGRDIAESLQQSSCTAKFSEFEDGKWHTGACLTVPATLAMLPSLPPALPEWSPARRVWLATGATWSFVVSEAVKAWSSQSDRPADLLRPVVSTSALFLANVQCPKFPGGRWLLSVVASEGKQRVESNRYGCQ